MHFFCITLRHEGGMQSTVGGIIMVRHAGEHLQVAYHVHPSKNSKVFFRTSLPAGTQMDRAKEAMKQINQTFEVDIKSENIVPWLSFADVLRDGVTYSEHVVAILDNGFDVKQNHLPTQWINVTDLLSIQWPWYRIMFVRQICTVMTMFEKHYNVLKRRTPEDVLMAPFVLAAQRSCMLARQIVCEAGRRDILYDVTVRGLENRYNKEEEEETDKEKSRLVENVFDLVTKRSLCEEYAALKVGSQQWFVLCDDALSDYNCSYAKLFGKNADEFLACMYRTIAIRLAATAEKKHEDDEGQKHDVSVVFS